MYFLYKNHRVDFVKKNLIIQGEFHCVFRNIFKNFKAGVEAGVRLFKTLLWNNVVWTAGWLKFPVLEGFMYNFAMTVTLLESQIVFSFYFLRINTVHDYLRKFFHHYKSFLSIYNQSINQSIGMYRMRWFLAVLRSLFHSSLSYTFSCYSSPPTILPSSLTSSSHLFLGLPLGLVVVVTNIPVK